MTKTPKQTVKSANPGPNPKQAATQQRAAGLEKESRAPRTDAQRSAAKDASSGGRSR